MNKNFKKIIKTLKKLGIFALIGAMYLSGFPQIKNFPSPPKIQKAYAVTCVRGTDLGDGFCTEFFTTTGTATYTSPSDWGTPNTIYVMGAGGAGATGTSGHSTGGGGGALMKTTNFSFASPGTTTATYRVGQGGQTTGANGGDTFFDRSSGTNNDCTDTSTVCAQGGRGGVNGAGSQNGGAGGSHLSGLGTTVSDGGRGGNLTGASGNGGSGGGGAGGTTAAGTQGTDSTSTSAVTTAGGAGGTASGGGGGAGSSTGNGAHTGIAGSQGTVFDSTHGAGGGGGGCQSGNSTCNSGGQGGGGPQGGGGGGATASTPTAGKGGNGLIVVKYTPAVAAPTQVVFTNSANTLTAGACSGAGAPFTIQLQNGGGTPTNPTGSTTINVSSNSTGTVTFYSDNTCGTQITSGNVSFTTSQNTQTFYVIDTAASGSTWTATAHQTAGPDTISDGTQTYTVNPGALDHYLVTITTPQTAGVCSTGTNSITAQDANNNTITSDSSTVNMTNSGSGVTFYTTNSCGSSTSTYTMSSGTSNIFYQTNKKQTFTITATKQSDTPTGTSSTITVNAGSVAKLVIVLPGQSFTDGTGVSGSPSNQTAGSSFNIANIYATDSFFNVDDTGQYADGNHTLAYSGPSNATNGQAPSYTTTVSFTNGASTTTLATTLYKAESPTITATDGGNYGNASSSVTVNAGSISGDVSDSTVTGSSTVAVNTPLTVTITLYDTWENPEVGITASHITLVSTGGSFSQPSSNTDSNGQTTGTVQWTTTGSKTVQAQITVDSLVQNDGSTADADGFLDNTLAVTVTGGGGGPVNTSIKGTIRIKGNTRIN